MTGLFVPPFGGSIAQVAIVVHDLDAALDRWATLLPTRRWRLWTFTAAQHDEALYHGRPTAFRALLALDDGSPQLELIQPLEGESIHREWLEARGEGFHHVGVIVDSVARTTELMDEAGFAVLQSGTGFGTDGGGAYAYYDTVAALGMMVEALEPAPLGQPEKVRNVD